jgi:hypothetical protein
MDEYFAVLVRIQENCQLQDRVKELITEVHDAVASSVVLFVNNSWHFSLI